MEYHEEVIARISARLTTLRSLPYTDRRYSEIVRCEIALHRIGEWVPADPTPEQAIQWAQWGTNIARWVAAGHGVVNYHGVKRQAPVGLTESNGS